MEYNTKKEFYRALVINLIFILLIIALYFLSNRYDLISRMSSAI